MIFDAHYNKKNIEAFLENTLKAALASNILAPLISLFIIYDLDHGVLFIWMTLHIFIFGIKYFLQKKALHYLQQNIVLNKEITVLLLLTSLTALLHAFIMFYSAFHKVPIENIFLLSGIMITMSAGSISTLMSTFHFFVLYVAITMGATVLSVLYYGGAVFNTYALMLTLFSVLFIHIGYQQYLIINNLVSLKDAFESIYEKSSDGIVIIHNHAVKDCNPAILKMFQYNSKEEFINTHILKLMPKYQEDGELSIKKMLKKEKETLQNGHSAFEWLYQRKDGSLFWAEIVLTKVVIDGEELIHGAYRDITLKKELELQKIEFQNNLKKRVEIEIEKNRMKDKQLIEQSRLAQMGEMISMIAHQWRQPLTAISSASLSIQLKAQLHKLDDDTAMMLGKRIGDYTQHLSSTIDDFRNFFKSNKEKKQVTYTQLLESVLNIVETSLVNKNITLIKEFESDTVFETYPNEIKQVILNLIKNAEDALLEKKVQNPYIRFKTKENKLMIEDNAGGISFNIIDKIFDPYFSTKSKNGSGLGLYMSKTIIEEHCGGTLTVSNTEKGALFTITLPTS